MANKKKEEVVVEETIIETPAEVTEEVPAEEVIEETTNVAPAEENEVTEETVIETSTEEVVVEEVIDQCDETTHGVVIADRLNVRKEADRDGDVVTIISKGTGVEVNLTKSTEEFYHVTVLVNNEFVDAYCVKEFIEIK